MESIGSDYFALGSVSFVIKIILKIGKLIFEKNKKNKILKLRCGKSSSS
jgi:hypothetical protein